MAKFTDQIRETIKSYFNTGDQPTESQFHAWITATQEGINEHKHTGAGNGDAEKITSSEMTATGVNAATYGSSNKIPVLTIDAAGRITNAEEANATGGTGGTLNIFGSGEWGEQWLTANTEMHEPRDYADLIISPNITLYTNGYPLSVSGTLTLNGTISAAGENGANGEDWNSETPGGEGIGGRHGYRDSPEMPNEAYRACPGTAGGYGSQGSQAGYLAEVHNSPYPNLAQKGAKGGDGNASAAGPPQEPQELMPVKTYRTGNPMVLAAMPRTLTIPPTGYHAYPILNAPIHCGATGGGGGEEEGQTAHYGGGGGGAGGNGHLCLVFARHTEGSGTITAAGGNGGNGGNGKTGTSGGGGGGAGGGGGWAILVTADSTTNITVTAAGGNGGNGGSGYQNGEDGPNGINGIAAILTSD